MIVTDVAVESLVPYARNPRNNTAAIDAVKASIAEFGFRQPIVVDEKMVVIVGHTRLEAAKQLGLKTVPVHVAEGLTPAQAKAYRIMDNRSHENAEWDDELLRLEFGDLKLDDFDLALTGFVSEELDKLLGAEQIEGLTDAARGRMLDAVGTLYVLKAALTAPVQAAQEFDRALAELGAKGNLTAEQMTAIGEAAKTTSSQMNQFAANIVKAQDFLVGMGLDVERATRAMPSIAQAATATGASLEDLSKAGFAAMSNLGLGAEDLAKSFDVMAAAGKAGGFELRDMAQYLPSITALASAKGMSGESGLAQIAAALQIVRRGAGDASEAATNFNNILQKINSNDAMKNFEELGIDIQKVLKDAKANGTDPLEASLRAINTAIGGDLSRLGEIFADAQVQKGLIPLLTGLEDYIKLRDEAARADGVISTDFARMMQTSVEQIRQFQIAFQNFQTGVGSALIPVLGSVAGALKPILEAATALVTEFPKLSGSLVAVTAGFIGLKAALAGLTFLGLMGKGGALTALSFTVNTLGGSLMRLKNGATGMIALQTALAGMEGMKMTGLQTAAAGLRGMALAVPGVSGLASAMTAVGAALATVSAPVWGGIALAVGAVAAAAYSLWKYWDRISSFAAGFASVLMNELQPAFVALEPVMRPIGELGRAIGDGFSWAIDKMTEFGAWMSSFFEREALSEGQKQAYAQAGADLANAMITAIKEAFNGLLAWFSALPSRIVAAIGSIDVSSLIKCHRAHRGPAQPDGLAAAGAALGRGGDLHDRHSAGVESEGVSHRGLPHGEDAVTGLLLSVLGAAWSRLSGWAALAAGIVAALGIAWLRGRAAGKAAWEAKRQAARDRAVRQSGEIRHDVQNSSDPALDRRLGRWMRD
jgi:TP901 family phage tail tape measure protein